MSFISNFESGTENFRHRRCWAVTLTVSLRQRQPMSSLEQFPQPCTIPIFSRNSGQNWEVHAAVVRCMKETNESAQSQLAGPVKDEPKQHA